MVTKKVDNVNKIRNRKKTLFKNIFDEVPSIRDQVM